MKPKSDRQTKDSATAPRGRFLMIGRRRGAIEAVEKLGFEAVVIDVPPRDEQARGAFGGSVQWALDAASELFPDAPPVGVAAMATGSVCAAATVRELFGLPGITRETALRCHDKLVMKKAIAAAGIPCAPWLEITANTAVDELTGQLGLPLVLKLPISSGGRGVWVCKTDAEVAAHLRPGMLAEGFVAGTEMSVETFRGGGRTLFVNPTRYLDPRWSNIVPAEIDLSVVHPITGRVHDALGIDTGISHMEIFLTADGPVFGEIAARPPGGHIMELLNRAYGFDPWEALVRLAVGQIPSFPNCAKQTAGVRLIHPGAGKVVAITGRREAVAIPEIATVSCRLRPGDLLKPRVGSGESKGKIVAEAPDHQACVNALQAATDLLKIRLSEESNATC